MKQNQSLAGKSRPLWQKLLAKAAEILLFLWMLHLFAFALFDLLPEAAIGQVGVSAGDPAVLQAARQRLGLEGSWHERYWSNMRNVLHGDLGKSIQGNYPVGKLLKERIEASVPLLCSTLIAALILGLSVGMMFCRRRLSRMQRIMLWLSHGGMIPQFLAAALFSAIWVWFGNSLGSSQNTVRFCFALATCALLPTTTLLLATANTAHELAKQPFVTAYEAIGTPWTGIRLKLLKNVLLALRPVGSRLILAILTGTVFAEYAFNLGGIGALLADAVKASDFPVAFAWLLFAGTATIVTSILCEGNYDYADEQT